MARPLQYQSQFIPTDFGQVGQMTNMLARDVSMRDQVFDQAVSAKDRAVAEIYGQETLDPELFQQAGDTLSNKIEEAVKARGMDYGAAAPDISRIVSKELRNPLYGLNRRKLEQVKQLEQQLARNPNLWVTQDPRTMDISTSISPEDIRYGVADPSEIDKAIESIYGDLGKQQREGLPIFDPRSGYNVATTTLGLNSQELAEMQQNPEVAQNILSNIPQLAPYLEQNPELAGRVQERITGGLQGLARGQRRQFIRPLEQKTEPNNLTTNAAIGSYFTAPAEVLPRVYKKAEKAHTDITSIIGEDNKVIEPKEKTRTLKTTPVGQYGFGVMTSKHISTEESRKYDKFVKYKEKYPAIYDKAINDAEFIDKVTNIEKDKAFILESRIGFNDPKFTEFTIEGLNKKDTQFLKLKDGEVSKKKVNWKEYNEQFKNSGLTFKDSKVFLTPKGELIMQDPLGEEYKLNQASLNTTARGYLDKLGNIYDSFYDYTLNEGEIDQLNRKVYSLGNNVYVKVHIPDGDVENKQLLIAYPDPTTGEITPRPMESIEQFYGYMSQLINADVFKGKK